MTPNSSLGVLLCALCPLSDLFSQGVKYMLTDPQVHQSEGARARHSSRSLSRQTAAAAAAAAAAGADSSASASGSLALSLLSGSRPSGAVSAPGDAGSSLPGVHDSVRKVQLSCGGAGDLGEVGFRKFFEQHTCNHLCKALQLRPHEWQQHAAAKSRTSASAASAATGARTDVTILADDARSEAQRAQLARNMRHSHAICTNG